MSTVIKKKTDNISNFVYRVLKDMIMNLKLKPRDTLMKLK